MSLFRSKRVLQVNFHFFDTNFYFDPFSMHLVTLATLRVVPVRRAKVLMKKSCPAYHCIRVPCLPRWDNSSTRVVSSPETTRRHSYKWSFKFYNDTRKSYLAQGNSGGRGRGSVVNKLAYRKTIKSVSKIRSSIRNSEKNPGYQNVQVHRCCNWMVLVRFQRAGLNSVELV